MNAISPVSEEWSPLGKRVPCPAQPSSSPALLPGFPPALGSLPPSFPLPQRSVVREKAREVGPHITNVWRRGLKLVLQINITKMQMKF